MRVVAVVQARMGSTRLPGKVLMDLGGAPMLGRVVLRVQRAKRVDEVVVATSRSSADDAIEAWCRQAGVRCVRGSEEDVLSRFLIAADATGAEAVVRITADCPLVDPEVVDRVVASFLRGGHDYVSNVVRYTYPEGLDVEVFSTAALRRAAAQATRPAEREHVTPFLRNSGRFQVANVEAEVDHGPAGHQWSVDSAEDLAFVRAVYATLGGAGDFGYRDVIALLDRRPDLRALQPRRVRNEGAFLSLVREPSMAPLQRSLERSRDLAEAAARLIPSGTQTFSKGRTQYVQGVAPVFLERAKGSRVWDVDGNEYIDLPMALGAVFLGHADEAVQVAVTRQLARGSSYSLPHPLEVEVAQAVVDTVPCAEKVRFAKNGADATTGAVRAARAFTGRDAVLMCGYHGWHDWSIGTTTRHKGVPEAVRRLTRTFAYNDLAALEQRFAEQPRDVAAVVMEPVGVVEPAPGYLATVKRLAHEHGALLVFDEVVTGYRLAMGGAQEHFGVVPDLACVGKAMANGFPLAAVAGRADVMAQFDEVFFSTTFGGEAVSLAAAQATLTQLRERRVHPQVWAHGRRLQDGANVLARHFGLAERVRCVGLAPRTVVEFKDAKGGVDLGLKSLFQQECLQRGVLFSGGQNISAAHGSGDIDETLRAYRAAMEVCAEAVAAGDVAARLKGPPVQPVFRAP